MHRVAKWIKKLAFEVFLPLFGSLIDIPVVALVWRPLVIISADWIVSFNFVGNFPGEMFPQKKF